MASAAARVAPQLAQRQVVMRSEVEYRVQAAVDRRFNRAKVDAQRTVDAFAERLRDEVDTDHIRNGLVEAVDRTLQPSAVTLWLR